VHLLLIWHDSYRKIFYSEHSLAAVLDEPVTKTTQKHLHDSYD
jgi:hypothetical protein